MKQQPCLSAQGQGGVQFSRSVVSDSLRPLHCSTPGLPVHHHLPELAQTHVHRVGDAIQPSHPLSSLLLLPSLFPSIRVFSSEPVLCIRWPKHWSFSFSISPSNEYSGLVSFRMDWLDLLAVQGTLKSLLQHHSSEASILQHWVGSGRVTLMHGPPCGVGQHLSLQATPLHLLQGLRTPGCVLCGNTVKLANFFCRSEAGRWGETLELQPTAACSGLFLQKSLLSPKPTHLSAPTACPADFRTSTRGSLWTVSVPVTALRSDLYTKSCILLHIASASWNKPRPCLRLSSLRKEPGVGVSL